MIGQDDSMSSRASNQELGMNASSVDCMLLRAVESGSPVMGASSAPEVVEPEMIVLCSLDCGKLLSIFVVWKVQQT